MSAASARQTAAQARAATSSFAGAGGLLQRKCGCGASKSALGASCDECQSQALQRKIAVGASDDPFEREADRVADRVLTLDPQIEAPPLDIRRVSQSIGSGEAAAPASVERTLNSAGQPLEPALRRDMEQRFGRDFGHVRIHADAQADRSARDVSALAYTVGNSIVFGAGQFSPSTAAGRRLLAHELTHVVQQTGAAPLARPANREAPARPSAPAPVQARLQRDPVKDDTSGAKVLIEKAVPVFVPDEIYWAYFWKDNKPGELSHAQLLIKFATDKRRKEYTSKWIAETSIRVLEARTGLKVRESQRAVFVDAIQPAFEGTREMETQLSFEMFQPFYGWFLYFEQSALERQVREAAKKKTEENAGNVYTMVAKGSLGPDPTAQGNDIPVEPPAVDDKAADKAAKDAVEREATKQYTDLEKQIKKERSKKQSTTRNLPDLVALWEKGGVWYLNVWVFLDTSGKDKQGKSLRLQPGETTENLLQRVRASVDETLAGMRQDEEQRRESQMPPWALKLKRELDERLGLKKGGEVPDGMSLVFEKAGPNAKAPAKSQPADAPAAPRVLLHIWVERGDDKANAQRNSGSVPLLETTNLDELEKYVRHLTTMLRQFERAPDMTEITRWDIGTDKAPMQPFKARILPQDLRSDKITIAGARNKFGMELNYDAQYQSGGAGKEMADMYVASKLYNQTIFFIWRIFKVPTDLKPDKPDEKVPTEWPDRWEWLYKRYNPGADLSGGQITWTNTLGKPNPPPEEVHNGEISLPGKLITVVGDLERNKVEASREPTSRVRFNDEPGEYLVFCETRHRTFGEYDLERAPAWAFYPVRTESRDAIITPLVTQTTAGIDTANKEIAALDAVLSGKELDAGKRAMLEAMRTSAQAHLDVLQLKERSGLVATTDAEIKEGVTKLSLVTQLKYMLPGLIKTSKENLANHVQPDAPSKMLQNNPPLLAMYWQLIQEQKTAEAYERELNEQVKQLGQVYQRASKYEGRLKSDAECIYSPEAVFVSEVDGNIYPLILSIGQLPSIYPRETAYQVADVTTEQTKDTFRGTSTEPGDDGHVEAIDDAFEEFGKKATYGEGWIGVRMPDGPSPACRERHHPGIKFYPSKEGTIEKVWKILGILAAVVGVAALVATGVGAPAAAALLGAAAGLIGAAVSIHNIMERQRKGTLEADAELALDIIGILGVGELAASAKLGSLARTAGGFATYERLGRFIAIYRVGQEGATAVLIPLKLRDDIARIKAMHLAPDVEKKMIAEAWNGALQSGLMFLGAAVGSRALNRKQGHGPIIENDLPAVRQQAELLSLEQGGDYKSMQEKGWIDTEGKWTSAAPDIVRKGNVPDPGTPDAVKAGMEGVERVNANPDLITEGKDGKRHAKLDPEEKHEIIEVDAPGGIACEYHSSRGPRVPCPRGMGDKAPRAPTEGTTARGEPPTEPTKGPAQEQVAPPNEPAQQPARKEPGDQVAPQGETARPAGTGAKEQVAPQGDAAQPLNADNLIAARREHSAALKRKQALTKNTEAARQRVKDTDALITQNKDKLADFRRRNPKAGPDNGTVRKYNEVLANLEKTRAQDNEAIKRADLELPPLDARLVQLDTLKQQFEGSKPWLDIKIGDPAFTDKQQGFVGEIEMAVGVQAGGLEPMGKTVRAEELLIKQDFDAALKAWDGQSGLDGLYRGKDAKGEAEFWVGESKTETKTPDPNAKRTDPRDTVGKLKTVESGERQLSDDWIEPRIDKFGLSGSEAREVKTAFKNGKVRRFYSYTDSKGTRFFEVHAVPGSRTEVKIGKEIFF